MNAPLAHPLDGAEIAASEAVYAERCEARALLYAAGKISLQGAVDELQAYAEVSGLVDRVGQDAAQEIMGEAFAMVDLLPDADDELNEACEREIILRGAEIMQRWEAADKRRRSYPPHRPEPYRPAESTVAAFRYVVSLDDPDYLAAWLAKHPADAPHLLKIWKARQCSPKR
jgi:hypothetical protein